LFYFKAEQQGCCESALGQDSVCAGRYEIKQGREYRVATRHWGGLSFPAFSLAAQRKGSRHQAKSNVNKE